MQSMKTISGTDLLERRIDPYWRKARIAARLVLKKEAGLPWSARDRRIAVLLADDPGVTDRLIDQAVSSLTARRKYGPGIMGGFR